MKRNNLVVSIVTGFAALTMAGCASGPSMNGNVPPIVKADPKMEAELEAAKATAKANGATANDVFLSGIAEGLAGVMSAWANTPASPPPRYTSKNRHGPAACSTGGPTAARNTVFPSKWTTF